MHLRQRSAYEEWGSGEGWPVGVAGLGIRVLANGAWVWSPEPADAGRRADLRGAGGVDREGRRMAKRKDVVMAPEDAPTWIAGRSPFRKRTVRNSTGDAVGLRLAANAEMRRVKRGNPTETDCALPDDSGFAFEYWFADSISAGDYGLRDCGDFGPRGMNSERVKGRG